MPLTVDFYDATGNLVVALEAQAESGPTPDSPEGPDVTESDEGGEDDDAALGVAGDEPEEFLSEQEALRESAGPGRIVGFVLLSEDARSGLRPSQPYCVGVSAYAGIAPGADVVVFGDGRSGPPDVTVLRGSALDAHTGCGMWFGVDVATADSYTISVGAYSATFNARELDENGWIVELWSDGRDRDAVCEEQMEYGYSCPLSAVLERDA